MTHSKPSLLHDLYKNTAFFKMKISIDEMHGSRSKIFIFRFENNKGNYYGLVIGT
jgi:hypothetical protein